MCPGVNVALSCRHWHSWLPDVADLVLAMLRSLMSRDAAAAAAAARGRVLLYN